MKKQHAGHASRQAGFTLVEVILAVSLLAIVLIGGTNLFFQNLRISGLSDVDLNVTNSLRSVLEIMEKDLRFAEVNTVGVSDRDACLAAGETGITASTLEAIALDGGISSYYLDAAKIASMSAQTGTVVYLNPNNVIINSVSFTWYCRNNVSDKIKIVIDASSTIKVSGFSISRSVSKEVNLLNSGIN